MADEKESQLSTYGVVAIGRNEGERLRQCLTSAIQQSHAVMYVDSGSTDDSVSIAHSMGCAVVELDMSIPFTAARARNEGFSKLYLRYPNLDYIQFVDGDCEVVDGWMNTASHFLDENPHIAAVCGRRRERHPERSVYNMLCDMEWDTPVGETRKCGGDVMLRIDAFMMTGQYREDLIAGEEPELCVRLRAAGWKIWRLGIDMTLHDAAMTRFGQWWRRTKRAGHAFAEGAWLHGAPPERHYANETRRALIWGVLFPCAVLVFAFISLKFIWALLLYPLQMVRISFKHENITKNILIRNMFLVIGRFPEGLGVLSFHINRILGKRRSLIEYK